MGGLHCAMLCDCCALNVVSMHRYDAARNGMYETVSALLNELYANSHVMSKEGMTAEQAFILSGHRRSVT